MLQNSPPTSGSLRNRLVLILIGGAAVLALLLYFAVRSYAAQIAQAGQDNILRASASSILDAAALRDDRIQIDIPYASFSMLNTEADDRVFYAIYQDGKFLTGYKDLGGQSEPPDQNADEDRFRSGTYIGEPVRIASLERIFVGSENPVRLRVTLAQTQDALGETLDSISRNAALLGSAFFLLAAILSLWASSVTIGQLGNLTSAVTRRGPQDLRPFVKPIPTEMVPLVTSLNSLMGRLDQSLSQSEDFIAEAAHRVRTPLATVRSYAESTLQRVDKEENRQAMRSMVKAIDESSRAAGQLLDHAMITFRADHLNRQSVDLAELVRELVMRLLPVADMKDLQIEVSEVSEAKYQGDPVLLQNALRNLIDNALKYAPPDTKVDVSVGANPRPFIKVQDQGPGFLSDEVDLLATRFKRGANAEGTIGSGLGLTIARDVALAHGGELRLSNNEKGGACVTLLL